MSCESYKVIHSTAGRFSICTRAIRSAMSGNCSTAPSHRLNVAPVIEYGPTRATIAAGLAGIDRVDHLVICAIHRDDNTVRNYDIGRATQLAILKLVGYTEVIHTLVSRLSPSASIVLFGGLAKERPYPGSTTVTTVIQTNTYV